MAACSKRRVPEETPVKDELKKSQVEGRKTENADGEAAKKQGETKASKSEEVKTEAERETEDTSQLKEFVLGERHRRHPQRGAALLTGCIKDTIRLPELLLPFQSDLNIESGRISRFDRSPKRPKKSYY